MSSQETGSMASQSTSALSISNHPPKRLPGPCLLHELVAQHSKLGLPSISSLSHLGQLSEVSYSELHQAADRLATRVVASRGVSPQSEFIVPVLIPQSTQLYIALLAILKAGGAFCPLNLDAPPERIKFILQDVGARVVLTTRDLASKVAGDELGVSLITLTDTNTALDLVTDFLVAEEEIPPIKTPELQSLAYVMYTSGSTGTPKGVGITHDAATQSLLAHDRHVPEFERFLQFASPTFDVSVFEIFFPLFRGCTLVTCDRSKMLDDLPGVMTAMRVDACELTPTVAGSLLRTRASVPSLKLLLTIGEMLTPRVVKEFGGDSTSPSILWGMYGPTEAAIHCTLQTAFSADSSPRVIGVPFDTVSCFVIEITPDDSSFSFTLLSIGQIGELVVGGYQLARNYLNRPEQTDAAFIDSPYGRLYRTGDKASMRSDGTLECFGRISDGQVKLRGQRIELGEVEQAAIRDPQCRDAIAMVVDNILVVFCVLEAKDSSQKLTSESILQTCRQWLPTFMIPGDVVIINEFPRLASGKIDRHQMRREYGVTKNTNTTVTQNDLGPLEKKITTVISNLVGSSVTLLDVLSAHGIDSLKAIQLASTLRKEGLQTSPLDVVSSRTISTLCTKVRAVDNEAQRQHHIKQPPDADQILASSDTLQSMESQIEEFDWCTQLQSSLLFETSANSSAYHNLLELEFPASCSLEQVRNCLEKMVQQNDILRSGFVETGGSFVRVIFKSLPKSQIQSVDQFTLSAQQTADDYESIWLHPFQAQVATSTAGAPPRLLLRMHHAIYDGWTVDLMIQDLSAILAGQEVGLRPQFGQVTAFVNSAPLVDLDISRAFWAEHLFDWQKPSFPRLMSRPPDTSEPQSMSRTLTLPEGDLREAAKKLGLHTQVFFQAAVSLIWGAILGTSDVVIGCVSSGRTLPVEGIEDIMGPCIASLPLRTDLNALRTVGDLLRNTQRTNRRSLQHGILPMSEIRRAASIQPGDALYDLIFVYQQSLTSHLRHASPVREISHRDFLETKILIEIEPIVDSFKCHITYHADAMSHDFATLFLDQIDCITRTLHVNPTALLHGVSQCVPPALVSIYNLEPVTLADSPDLATCFERSASAAPDADAICFAKSITPSSLDCETMSYQELNNLSNRIAWFLRSQRVLEGDTVAIVMEKSTLLYATILGTLKAGAAYLPLLPSTPASRLQLILSQASTTACLVDQQAIVAVADVVPCPLYDIQSTSLSEFPTHNPPRRAQPSRPAYIIYTSGTTGVPKGIVVTQLNITSNLDVLSRLYPHDITSRFLQLCSQAFDVSVFEIFFTWRTGACLCAGSNDTLFADLEQSIRSLGCTHLSLTPTVASLISPSHVPKVQFLVTAGEPMTSAVSESWGEYLYQGYGPAETTNICTVKKMTKGDYINHLGFAFENVSAFVLSTDSMSSVPRGCFGEFCFGGDQVAQGYIDLAEVTSSKFVNHPEFGRIYRSGDMGRMLPDGSLLVTGRLDGQVKLRGQRIETGEIDSIVTAAKEVLSCTSLILQPTGSSSEQLVSFYTPAAQKNLGNVSFDFQGELAALNQQLFVQLSSRLPRYMVPSYLIPLGTIPQTSSGKVDKAVLRSLFNGLTRNQLGLVSNNQEHRTDEDEWSDSERLVAEVIAQSLNVPRDMVSRWQPLATIGLDSISAISVARLLGDAVNRRIPISHILQNPNVARLARLVTENAPDELLVEDEATDSPFFSQDIREHITTQFAEHKHAIQEVLPCTPLQEAMLSAAGASSYSNQLLLRLAAASPEMKSHWQTLIDRHGILRTCFVTTTDAQRRVPFALDSQQPPYGLDLLDIDNTFFLVFTCHHALYDGESMSVLLQEIEQLVRGEGLPSPIPYTPVIRQMLSPQPSSEGFWKALFNGFVGARRETFINRQQALPLGSMSTPPRPQTYTSQLSLDLTAWQKVARHTNTSILALGQATWAILLGIVSDQDDVCFGNVMSGRTLPVSGIERLVAPCFNTVPIRIETNRRMQVSDLLTKLHVLNSKLLDHQFASLRSIQKLVSRPGRSLFDTILLLQPPKKDLDSAIWEVAEDTGGMDVPLVCELIPNAHTDKVELNLHTNNATLDPRTASSISQAFSYILCHIARHPATVIPTKDDLPEDIRSSIANASHESPQNNLDQQESSFASPSHSVTVHEEPWSELEKTIRDILSKLSGVAVSRIGPQTTIFQLGLDSINAVQIAALLRKQDHNVSTFDVVDCPSCVSLAQRIARRVGDQSQVRPIYDVDAFQQTIASTVAVQLHTEPEAVFPCTPVQCGMLKDFIESGGVDYLNYLALELDQHLGPEEVKNAWRQLVQAHTILRTGLALEFVTAFIGESPESHSVTFKELDEMGNRVANTLAQHVASRGIVAVHFDKCPEAFFAILGILKAGCSFLALDPSAPKARKEFILRDSGAVALLARDALDFQPAQTVVEIEESKLYAASAEPCQLGHNLSKDDTCYCLYTSGTTGTPKGCEITHENAVQAMKAFQRLFAGHWDEESRWLQFASFHFDVSVLEQYWSWSVAMPLVVVPRDIILDDIAATIRRLRITHLDLTPSLARLLDPKDVPTLCRGVFITGGEALKQEILDTWGPQGVIYNAYGPTEATIGVTMYQRVPQNGRASNIGRQFDNVGTYVFEPGTEKPVLRGAVGELCISGKLVGKGYLNRPELTAERFPVLEHFKEKIYRTGDLVRVMYDGCFEFLGRADDQVKLRGQRLEIGEINHAIRTGVAAVKDVVTLVTKHPKVDKDLLVTFVTSSEAATSIGELEVLGGAETFKLRQTVLKACRHKLPGYMVPSYVLEVPFIPLSINNKAEMKILRHLFASLTPELLLHVSAPAPSQEALATTKTQKTVLRAVSKFSGVSASELSLNSNLFDLGIDSISCLRLSRLLKHDGLRTADPALVLKNPFLGDLAEALSDPYDHEFPSAVREAQQQIHAFSHRFRHEVRQRLSLPAGVSVDYIAPCTPLQEGTLSRTFSKGEESYFVSFQLKLSDNLVASRLQESWDKLVALHPILRTRFVPTSGGFAQVALSPTQIPWKSHTVDQDGVKLLLQEARSSWIKNNQDSILEPMECLLVDSEGDRLLVVHIFHALYDGISFESMLQWLADDMSQKAHAQRPAFLDTLSHGPLQNFDHSRSFWSEHLSSCTFEPLPRIIADEAPGLRSVRRLYNVERLRETSKALNITLQSAVLSLWSGTFGKYFSPKAAMGVVVSGRALDIEDVEDVMGPLFNTLPFYPDVATNNTLQKLAQRCHDFNVSTLPFQHTALRNIQKWCSGGHPIFDNLFVYQNDVPLANNAETFWTVEDSFVANDYPLAFEATAKGDADLQVQIVVRQDVATEADLQRILEDFEEAVFALSTGRAGTLRNQAFALTSQESSAGASPLTTRSASTDSAGHSTDVSAPEFTVSNFGWTEATLAIRFEISKLAQIPAERVSECNSLLELGLDSIDIVSLSTRLKQKGIDISMSQLLRAQNIESMEKVIGREVLRDRGEKSDSTFDALLLQLHEAVVATGYDMGTVESVLPPTPLQESMVADMIDSDFERYFNHDVMEISKDTIVESLVDAWLEVISQSPILRTVFLQVDDPRLEQTFCQIVLAHHLPSIQHIQLQGEQEIEGVYAAHRRNASDARGASQLLQLTIANVGDRSYVVFSIAHALYDGWSLALLHQDVDSAYHNMLEQRPSPRNILKSLLQSPTDKSQRFWSQYLAGAPPSLLPESTTPPTDSIHHDETMSSLSSGEVMAFCKRNSVTLQVLGQACWSTVLATRLGALDVSFGVVLSGRDTEEAQNLMFPTMNTVALRCVLHGSARSFLRYLQDTMSDVYEYQTFPLRRAQLAGKQAPGGLFNTLFLLQRQPDIAEHRTKKVGLTKSVQTSATTDFAVCVELEATEDQLIWRVAGKESSTSEHDVKELLEHLDRAMNHFVQRPEGSLLQFEGDRTSICHLPAFVSDSQTTMPDSGKDNGNTITLEEPESQVESTIRKILSEVSGIPYESISRDSTAYHLGLDSISLIKVSSILKKKDIMLGVHALLTASSLSHMAKVAGNAPKTLSVEVQEACMIPDKIKLEQVQSLAGFTESQVEDVLPAVPMQVYMMTAWQNSQGRVFYPAFRYRLDESVSLDAVQKAWADLTATETLLRTCLVATGDWDMPFLQIVLAPNVTGPHSQILLLSRGSEEEVAGECWPKVRMTAEQRADGAWELTLNIHHALYDGITLPGILDKLRQNVVNNNKKDEHKNPSSRPWRSFIAHHQSPGIIDERKAFWTKYLADDDDSAPPRTHDSFGDRTAYLRRSAVSGMGTMSTACASNGVGLPALMFAAVAQSLHARRVPSSEPVIFGIYYSNRAVEDDPSTELYPTLNLLPLKVMVQEKTRLMELAHDVQQDLHRIMSLANSTVGLWEIKEWTGVAVDVFVNFLNLPKGQETPDVFHEVVDDGLFNGVDRPTSRASPDPLSFDAPWLSKNPVRGAFPAAMDIEAAVNGDTLDIGVFGSVARTTIEEAQALVDAMAECLSIFKT
ncbi:hypothetical protein BN1708_010896 [Verticillium longisporum]|uniref:Carrier domain-containing protein n=1 Tax=Verticillium longisporum TaxID=100787 RepID=A0A0G4KVE5_VERLO|nr:hypothetical protein BN1708_010896 [Verticillium longisporum]